MRVRADRNPAGDAVRRSDMLTKGTASYRQVGFLSKNVRGVLTAVWSANNRNVIR
ncbi:MAG: hypothetical protein H8F28_26245 [Fibrella sp.]|nr:hypothetical protein [Armatimonadota bacterium]